MKIEKGTGKVWGIVTVRCGIIGRRRAKGKGMVKRC